jgi:transcriptional regulator with GAF, ATPase, and Fis domain
VVVRVGDLADGEVRRLADELRNADPTVPILIHDTESRLSPECLEYLQDRSCRVTQSRTIGDEASQSEATPTSNDTNAPWRRNLLGESPAMQKLYQTIRLIGPRQATVMITGETGTGKEVVARAIHQASQRRQRPMIPVNCAALPETLLETELFGHAKGAFTGAVNQHTGRFEQADRSTIFLDEIGEMPLDLQAKLLRVLQEREIQKVGSAQTVRIDVRVIAASNNNLERAIAQNEFRPDLYYRLNVVSIRTPALRERLSDIPLLADHFIEKVCKRERVGMKRISQSGIECLMNYGWPGNVRELEHAIEKAVLLSGERAKLEPADFDLTGSIDPWPAGAAIELPESGIDFEEMMIKIQRAVLDGAIRKAGGNKARAAGLLGMKRTTLISKVKSLSQHVS